LSFVQQGVRFHVGVAVLALSAVMASPTPSSACSVAGPPVALAGYPEDGAVGVPTDVIPLYETDRLGFPRESGPEEFYLRDAAGTAIPIAMSVAYTWHVACGA
jgi:hypothetical protein